MSNALNNRFKPLYEVSGVEAKVAALSVSIIKPEVVKKALEKVLLPIKRIILVKPNLENAKIKLTEAKDSLEALLAYNSF